MKTRPWPIVILAIIHFLAPFYTSFLAAFYLKMNYLTYLELWLPRASLWGLFYWLVPYPLAGFAIYKMKPWSYPVFLSLVALNFGVDVHAWWNNPKILTLPIILTYTLINIALVTYFLLPAVKRPYFNRALRWWESKPRYCLDLPAQLEVDGATVKGQLGDISEGGVFFQTSKKLELKENYVLSFELHTLGIQVRTQTLYKRKIKPKGYGLKFLHTEDTQKKLHAVIQSLETAGTPLKGMTDTLWVSFLTWSQNLFKTGKGLLP